ncbi:MAG: hypothetical protein CSA36_04685 [Draconibacterium sp.]|nr:MAG: hypothetical protein CSA36_04685 [Draconibacterium sp.]
MTKKTGYLIGILLTILIGTLLYWWLCCNCGDGHRGKEPVKSVLDSSFRLNGEGIDYQCADNFIFPAGSFSFREPVSGSVNQGIELLKTRFEKNDQLKLAITGFCSNGEKNTSVFPNLGYARANVVKNYFAKHGINSSRILINGEIKDTVDTRENLIHGPLAFLVKGNKQVEGETTAFDVEAFKEELNTNPLVLYFETNQTNIELTPEQKQTVLKIVDYLGKVPDATVLIVGHTDNSGPRDANMKVGQQRADFAKDYFVNNGFPGSAINSTSKGPDEPIADNNTEEGKAKNRRTVISIQ